MPGLRGPQTVALLIKILPGPGSDGPVQIPIVAKAPAGPHQNAVGNRLLVNKDDTGPEWVRAPAGGFPSLLVGTHYVQYCRNHFLAHFVQIGFLQIDLLKPRGDFLRLWILLTTIHFLPLLASTFPHCSNDAIYRFIKSDVN